ncbi:MAG: tRNA adenosine deaminase-associated protein [Propionibacteriaceae bacterium]|jgi:putative tRNA adenosine deaminase-associated protein|nr:tRNA adenosine deaminase-associated protein [Propionibacteriaceae bacterium]
MNGLDDRPGIDEIDDVEEFDEPEDVEDDGYPEDATDDEIDLVAAFYREDGAANSIEFEPQLANDLEEFITQLRRIPGDAGALGMISIDSSVFVLARVRGKMVQLLLNDIFAAFDWPIARDVLDYLEEDLPDEDEDTAPIGDLDILSDVGVSEFDMEALASDYEEDSLVLLGNLAKRIGFGPQFNKLVPEA